MSDNYSHEDGTDDKSNSDRPDAGASETELSQETASAQQPFTPEEWGYIRSASLSYVLTSDGSRIHLLDLITKTGLRVSELRHSDSLERCWKIAALILILSETGMRPFEVSQLTVHDLNLEDNSIRLPTDVGKGSEGKLCRITDRTATATRRWLEQRSTRQKYDDTDLLFLDDENRNTDESLRELLREVADDAGIHRPVTSVAFRRAFAHHFDTEESP